MEAILIKYNRIGVYKIVNVENSKVYVGSSIDMLRREKEHFRMLKGNYHDNVYLQNSFNKNGINKFSFEVIETVKDDSDREKLRLNLLKVEQYWIDYYKSSESKKGYNIQNTAGSNLGMKFSEESRQRMRESEKSNRPIYQIDFNGNVVRRWEYGASEASKSLEIGQANIFKCLHKTRRTYKGYIWIFIEEFEEFVIKPYLQGSKKVVIQVDMSNSFIKKWNSLSEIEKELGISCGQISRVCRKQRQHAHGYKWFYEEDYEQVS